MAINLFTKYYAQIQDAYTHKSFLKGKSSKKYNFAGVKTIEIPNIVTQALSDYQRTSTGSRYGTLAEVQDEIQEESCTKDRSFKLAIDKGNNSEQQMVKNAGRVLSAQIKEQVVPEIDKWAMQKWCKKAGKLVKLAAAITTANIAEYIIAAETHFDDNFIPIEGRYVITSNANIGLLRQAFTSTDLGVGHVFNGVRGQIGTLNIVGVPASYLPAGVAFLAFQTNSVVLADKIDEARIVTDSENVSGAILLGRYIYDAFVVGHICNGVYCALVNTATVCTTPVLTVANASTGSGAITLGAAGQTIYYTLDGSDPRYSKSAIKATAALSAQTWPAGTVVKAYAEKSGAWPTEVAAGTAT